MRMLLNVTIPHEDFNEAVRDGSAGPKLSRIMQELKPEAAYFTEQSGYRSAILIVDVSDPSKVPSFAEPFFLLFNANVEFHIVMSWEDIQRAGLDELQKKWTL